jgi:hypothetical protein
MKTLFLFTLSIVLSLSLNARENPFMASDTYESELGKHVDEAAIKKAMEESSYIKEMEEKMSGADKNKVESNSTEKVAVPEEKSYSKKEVDNLIQKTQKQTEQKTKELVKKEVQKNGEPNQVVYVKPRPDATEEENPLLTKNILPFLKVEFNDNKLIIHTEHKVSKKFTVEKENKLIIDYSANIEFNTKKDELESKSFKRIALGNHKSEGFFRVAVELIDKPTKFEVDYKDDIITITKKAK